MVQAGRWWFYMKDWMKNTEKNFLFTRKLCFQEKVWFWKFIEYVYALDQDSAQRIVRARTHRMSTFFRLNDRWKWCPRCCMHNSALLIKFLRTFSNVLFCSFNVANAIIIFSFNCSTFAMSLRIHHRFNISKNPAVTGAEIVAKVFFHCGRFNIGSSILFKKFLAWRLKCDGAPSCW